MQNEHDEWIHDVYEESVIHYGMIYSVERSFHPQSTSITGCFLDEGTYKWIKVVDGAARLDQNKEWWINSLYQLLKREEK